MGGRILVIRGGAIGDFVLTLPALHLLRSNFPDSHIEILGYGRICELAHRRYYADAIRSIDYAPMAGFFNPRSELDKELTEYFSGFHQIVSYLYDPDELFASCLRRAGVKSLIPGSPKIHDGEHAACQLARPLEGLALFLEDPAAHIYPDASDSDAADTLLNGSVSSFIALHPGSGGERKNWPIENWRKLVEELSSDPATGRILIIAGESDEARIAELDTGKTASWTLLQNLPLNVLAAVLARCRLFVGHDSGISHIAAATGIPNVLLFGPTDPDVWAPANPGTRVIRAPGGQLEALEIRDVLTVVRDVLDHV